MSESSKSIGNRGEDLAVTYLKEKAWIILDRNYSFERAEVDIVATDTRWIIFVEVKTRSNSYFGHPEEFVTPAKEANLKKAAEAWIYERKMETAIVRFDIISIIDYNSGSPEITHFEDAFR